MLVRSNEAYRKYIHVDEKGKKVVYLELKKALYGTMMAAKLFWQTLTHKLEKYGFTPNDYDSCVMNKEIDGFQCTVLWHVDDLKISHKDPAVVTKIINYLKKEFDDCDITITRGLKHTYVGMDIDFSQKGCVMISMNDYLEEAVEAFPDSIDAKVTSPAGEHLFDVNANAEKISNAKQEIFHHIVAKLLFVSTRARPDLQVAISFLTSRVIQPTIDDWKKLRRVISYVNNTKHLYLTLSSSNTSIVKFWTDAAYGVRDDYKSQTGSALSFGRGVFMTKSTKQKINTKSATEAELIAASDMIPQLLWTRYFLESQGYNINEAILFQDNKSAILLETNGRASSSKRTKHINIRYFFMKDRIAQNEFKVEYCPTNEMLGDFFTKPLQGQKFIEFRDLILGFTQLTDDNTSNSERVGN